MSMIYSTLQKAQASAGSPGQISVVPPVLFSVRGNTPEKRSVWIGSLAGILAGILIGLLLVG